MPRKKPTKTTDVIGLLELDPEKVVGDYIESQLQREFFVKPPNWDTAGDSIEMLYIANLRENESMVAMQKDLLANAKRQADINFHRIRKMYKMQERLRKRFIEVNGFIKECVDKRYVAEKSIVMELALHEELRKGIDEFKKSVAALSTFRDDLKATVKEFDPYEAVLVKVVKASNIFVSPKDCMDRCDALMLAQVEINQLEQEKIQELEQMRQRIIQITSEAALTVLGLKNDLGRLERSYNKSRTLCHKYELVLSNCKKSIIGNEMEKERTYDGAHVLYRLFCKRSGKDAIIERKHIEPLMNFIKREMELLTAVLQEIERPKDANKKDKSFAKAGC